MVFKAMQSGQMWNWAFGVILSALVGLLLGSKKLPDGDKAPKVRKACFHHFSGFKCI